MVTRSASKPARSSIANDGHGQLKLARLHVLRCATGLSALLLLLSRAWSLATSLVPVMVNKSMSKILTVGGGATSILAAPSGFPASGNGLWYTEPGTIWSRHSLPIGNGFLGAMTPGGIQQEVTQLNIESLWSGGPFADPNYNGGNKETDEQTAMVEAIDGYRQSIFSSSNGTINDVNTLTTDPGAYGSYSGAGYLISTLANVNSSQTTNYGRFLDLDNGIAKTLWTEGNVNLDRESFCSNPAKACIQSTSTTSTSGFTQTYAFSTIDGIPVPSISCSDNSTLKLIGLVSDPGMAYELLATVRSTGGSVSCAPVQGANGTNATVTVNGAKSAWIIWVGGTNYNIDAGDAAHNFTFQGPDPHSELEGFLTAASGKNYSTLLAEHQEDYKSVLTSKFSLDLGQKPDLSNPTDVLRSQYQVDTGNPYLEWVTFNYGRYMLASSARGVLPANLQGKWAKDSGAPWSGDYHANINIQMNYWAAETTNLDVSQSLFDYIEKTWVPRGAYTAKVLYNITRGWVTHDEMNIFGHTGMKMYGDSAEWANYPESNAWLMLHVWDHFDYTHDVSWWKSQGYPLLKSVAQFHLDKLVPDERFDDGTLVVVPCNSPEQAPVTLACSHAQQLIWQLFNAVEKGFSAAGDNDADFLAEVKSKKAKMDKGIHIGSWGELQEWKVDLDSPTDTHRHLSHLIGLYPGYAVSGYQPSLQGNFTKQQVLAAAQTSLIHRGNGTGPDADAGWEKAWRAACWAQFANASEFYHELTYTLYEDFGQNLFSLYDPFDADPIFQIDANLGYPAAVMNALIQAPDVAEASIPLTITILPALPSAWATGSLTGARVRGGITVDLAWSHSKPTKLTLTVDKGVPSRPVQVVFAGKKVTSFHTTSSGSRRTITSF